MKDIKKLMITLVALLALTTGAWADETPLLTIESTDYQSFRSGSMTFDDKVTITFSSSVKNDGDNDGWYYAGSPSLLTVAGTNGYTITSCKFYTGYEGIAMTGYTVKGESPSVYLSGGYVYTDASKSVSIGASGVTKIEVYGGVASSATDPNAVTAAEINSDLYSGWSSIDEKLLKASDLPGFQAVTENQAKSWTGVPSTGRVKLFYDFVADGNVKVVIFNNGVYDSSYEEEELTCYLIYEDIKYNGDTKYFYTTGPAPSGPEVAWDKDKNSGSFTMPGGNVTLEPEYYPQAALTAAPTAINDVPATTDGAIVNAGTVMNIGETTNAQGTVMYYASQTALDDAALLALAADQWTADVPTAAHLAQGQAHVYYYVRGNDSDNDDEIFSDGDILATNALTVTIAAEPTYAVTFAEGTEESDKWTASPAADVKKGQTVTVTYSGTKKVIGVKAEKKAAAFAADEYNEASWDDTNKKLVFEKKKATTTPVSVADAATNVTWGDGWYTVSGNVTITGNVTLTADAHLILQDGATLTINGQLDCRTNKKNLYIYGQKKGDGKLNVTNNGANAINSRIGSRIDIHGVEVTAAATGNSGNGLNTGYLAVYGGKITATSGGGNGISFQNTFDFYDGEVEATSNATSSTDACYGIRSAGFMDSEILTVYGGKVTATGNGKPDDYGYYGSGFGCYVKSGTSGIKFYFSDNGTTWGDGTGYDSATEVGTDDADAATKKRYAKAE